MSGTIPCASVVFARCISDCVGTKFARLLRTLDDLRFWPRRIKARHRMEQTVLERVAEHSFVVLPQVFNPNVFRSGRCLAQFIAESPLLNSTHTSPSALDVGTGTGIQAVFLADRGYAVTAVDVSARAVRCATINVLLNGMNDQIEVLESDLFAKIAGRMFDLVVFNPPFFKGVPNGPLELAWRSNDVVERFAAGLPGALKSDGRALIVWSSHAEERDLVGPLLRANLRTQATHRSRMGAETVTIYEVQH